MPKEDRSDWVAVESEFANQSHENSIQKVRSAYQFFQKDVSAQIREEYGKVSNIAEYGKIVKQKWNALTDDQREHYQSLHRQDVSRFAQESHLADVAALERREKLRQERNAIVMDDDGGRLTRRGLHKKERKKERHENKKAEDSDYEESDSDSWDSTADSDDSGAGKKIKKKKQAPRQASQKQLEHRAKVKQEKLEKEAYIAGRQEDLRKERSSQAKRRLEYLLKQGGNIFSHFGNVKEDTAKYGINKAVTTPKPRAEGGSSRRDADQKQGAADQEEEEQALLEADEHEATFLTAQPKTLAFGKMRPYQLEGLNWMIRLQENGVNGILADGTYHSLLHIITEMTATMYRWLQSNHFIFPGKTEMGLGKTLQSISILVYMQEFQNNTGPHLVVVPKSTLSNWMNEIARWAPTLKTIRFHGDKASREEIVREQLEPAQRDENREWNVCVTTYEVCNIEKNVLSKFAWCYLIIDEAHRLKNEASAFSKTVRSFETRYRILLTGTPLQNSLHELWALLNFLVPDVFESADQFE